MEDAESLSQGSERNHLNLPIVRFHPFNTYPFATTRASSVSQSKSIFHSPFHANLKSFSLSWLQIKCNTQVINIVIYYCHGSMFCSDKSHCVMCGSHLVPSSINFPRESPKVFSLFPLSLSQHKRKRALSVSKLLSKFKQYEGTLAATCDNILIKSHTKRKTKTKYLKK